MRRCCYPAATVRSPIFQSSLFFFLTIAAALHVVKPVFSWLPSSHQIHQKAILEKNVKDIRPVVASTALFTASTTTTTTTTRSAPAIQSDLEQKLYNEMVSVSPRLRKLFRGQTVLITGASSGLGRCLALQLASCGVQTLVLSARNEDSLNSVAEECQQAYDTANLQETSTTTTTTAALHGFQVYVIPCDLSRPDDVAKLGSQALELCHGRIDVLINNGGISSRSRFVDTQLAVDEQLMQVNFFSGAALAKTVVPGMIERGFGKIIWVSSVQGLMGIPHRTSYAASKFAVQGYCEALRAELSSHGISVHVASPGYIRTNLSQSALTGDGTLHGQVDAATAKGALPQDVAQQVLNHVAAGRADFVVAATPSAHVAIWLRFICPSLLRYMLVRRYQKTEQGHG